VSARALLAHSEGLENPHYPWSSKDSKDFKDFFVGGETPFPLGGVGVGSSSYPCYPWSSNISEICEICVTKIYPCQSVKSVVRYKGYPRDLLDRQSFSRTKVLLRRGEGKNFERASGRVK